MNLIITCARSLESETKNEISKILDELGDQEPEILNVGMRGILMIKLKDAIQKNDSYRITIEKRNTSISSNEIITEIAKIFPNKVSLNQPDWIILIEILGNETGISILKDDGMFSLDKAKRMSD